MCLITWHITIALFSPHWTCGTWMIHVSPTYVAVVESHVLLPIISVSLFCSRMCVVVWWRIVVRNIDGYMAISHVVIAFLRFLPPPRAGALSRVLVPVLLMLRLLSSPKVLRCCGWWLEWLCCWRWWLECCLLRCPKCSLWWHWRWIVWGTVRQRILEQ